MIRNFGDSTYDYMNLLANIGVTTLTGGVGASMGPSVIDTSLVTMPTTTTATSRPATATAYPIGYTNLPGAGYAVPGPTLPARKQQLVAGVPNSVLVFGTALLAIVFLTRK